jgi:drug/metabolite transporter (DMT)-like permease
MAPGSAHRPDRATLLAFAGVALFGGLNTVAVHEIVTEVAPIWGASSRFLAAGAILALIVAVRRRPLPRGRSLWGAVAYGLVGFAAFYALAYTALHDIPAGTAGVLLALSPLATFALAIAQGQERFRPEGLAGSLIAIGGVAVVFVDQLEAAVPLVPLLLFVGAVACLAEANVIAKWLPESDPFTTNAIAMLVAGAVLLLLSIVSGESLGLPARAGTWIAVVYVVAFGSVALFVLYLFALERWTASAVSYTTLLMPLVAIAAAALLTGERFSVSFLIGGVVILLGVYVGAFLRRRPRSVAPSPLPDCLPAADTAR